MDNQRKKLIELLDIIIQPGEKTLGDIADHILADGWIRLPCKVGDVVYRITRNKVKECEVVFIGISADTKCSYFNYIENYADGTFYKSYSTHFDDIGKIVFLSREDAEKELEERKEK